MCLQLKCYILICMLNFFTKEIINLGKVQQNVNGNS